MDIGDRTAYARGKARDVETVRWPFHGLEALLQIGWGHLSTTVAVQVREELFVIRHWQIQLVDGALNVGDRRGLLELPPAYGRALVKMQRPVEESAKPANDLEIASHLDLRVVALVLPSEVHCRPD